ncbi:MAG: hypothetical protein AABY86_12555, partial [Bdellovibrionota bacterium]
MNTRHGKLFPSWRYFLIILCLFFLFGCNSETDIPKLIEATLTLKSVNQPSPIVAQSLIELDLKIENTGLQPASLGSFTITEGQDNFRVSGGTCGTELLSLGPSEGCNYLLEFSPSVEGTYALGFNLGYYSGDSTVLKQLTVALKFQAGASIPVPSPKKGELVLETPLIHGDTLVNSKKEIIYTLRNIGTEKVRVDEFYFEGGTKFFTIAGGTCATSGLVMQANSTCTYIVSFAPTSLGPITQNMVVGYYPGDTWSWTALTL